MVMIALPFVKIPLGKAVRCAGSSGNGLLNGSWPQEI